MVLKYIMEKASESNPITNADIMEFLKCNKVNPCKKTLISMIKSIKEAGFDLITVKEKRTNMYYIPSENFDTTEARLLIDSVISAKFVTPKKAEILLEKLVGLSDRDMLLQYMKDIVVENRQKHRNCYSYYSIDVIQEALAKDRRINFKYFDLDENKNKIFRHNGKIYEVCPMMGSGRYKILRSCQTTIDALSEAMWDSDKPTADVRLDDGTTNIDNLDAQEYSTEPYMSDMIERKL